MLLWKLKNWKVFFEGMPSKKNQPSNFVQMGQLYTIFGGGEPQQETIYSYWLANVSESNLASNRIWKLRKKHVGVVNAREALEKKENIYI